MTEVQSGDLIAALDEASIGRVHLRAVVASGIGFFTDAYDLFVIGIASALITKDWHLNAGQLSLLNSVMLGAAFLGALVFGRYADVVGRKRVYWLVAAIMIAGALGSALSGSYWVLLGFRFLLGFGVGGDYPVSAVHGQRDANRKDRGKLVGMVFGTQALGLDHRPARRPGPARLRRQRPTWPGGPARPRRGPRRCRDLPALPDARITALPGPGAGSTAAEPGRAAEPSFLQKSRSGAEEGSSIKPMGLRAFLTSRRWLIMLAGTAGCWFLLDYAYYGNTISTPQILSLIDSARLHHDQDRPAAGDLLGRRRARLHPGHHPAGQDRPPPPAAHRVRRHGLCAS